MKKITNNIYLIGLGAIGGAFAAQAFDTGNVFSIICDEQRKKRYESNPHVINGNEYKFNYVTQNNDLVKPDIVLISVKYMQLYEAINLIDPFLSNETIIISLLNGIDSEQIISRELPSENIVHAFVKGTDALRINNKIDFTQKGKIVLGAISKKKEGILFHAKQKLESVGISIEIADNIERALWWKFMLNIGINQVSALIKAQLGQFHNDGHPTEMVKMAMNEVITVANYLGIDLNNNDIDLAFDLIKACAAKGKASMLQDIDACRQTEVDMFSGVLCRLSEENRLETPINKFLLHSIKSLENQDK